MQMLKTFLMNEKTKIILPWIFFFQIRINID